jgi:glycosyltransferase involved in cell wall biosynthesis
MGSTPSISVLIPTFNRAAFLPSTIASIFAQTIPVHDVILVDDGSNDGTEQVIASLLVQHPDWNDRLRYVRQENHGKSVALNNALQMARGEWIAFNDSDDCWSPDKLEWQFTAFARYGECGACFTETSLKEFGSRHPELTGLTDSHIGRIDAPAWLFAADWPGIYMQTVLVRAAAMRHVGGFDPRYRVSQDVDFLFRLGLITSFCYVDLPLVEIRREPNRTLGLMTNHPSRSLARVLAAESMLNKWSSLIGEGDRKLRKLVKYILASERSALANRYVLTGDMPAARRVLQNAITDSVELRLVAKWLMTYTMPGLLRAITAKRAPLDTGLAEILRSRESRPGARADVI